MTPSVTKYHIGGGIMGLDVTYDCWHGAYSAFGRWRTELASLVGLNLKYMDGFCEDGILWEKLLPDPLYVLLNHSDCEGIIRWQDAAPLARRLQELLPLLPKEPGWGHLIDWKAKTQQFIDGLFAAAVDQVDVEFW